jgi:hypothetical protein
MHETIATLEEDIERYKARLAEQFDINMKMHEALNKIRNNIEKEFLKALK